MGGSATWRGERGGVATRGPLLNVRQDAPQVWRFVDVRGGGSVGPEYATQAEALADLGRYTRESLGWVGVRTRKGVG